MFLVPFTRYLPAPSAGCSLWGSQGAALDPNCSVFLHSRPRDMGYGTGEAMGTQEELERHRGTGTTSKGIQQICVNKQD